MLECSIISVLFWLLSKQLRCLSWNPISTLEHRADANSLCMFYVSYDPHNTQLSLPRTHYVFMIK